MWEGQRNPAESPERCQGETHGTEVLMQQGKEGRRARNFNKQQAALRKGRVVAGEEPRGDCGPTGAQWG